MAQTARSYEDTKFPLHHHEEEQTTQHIQKVILLRSRSTSSCTEDTSSIVPSSRREVRKPLTELEQLVLQTRPKARRLARSFLRRWRSRIDIQEVDSIVDLALCEAVSRFDPTKGASFLTFLYFHLKGHLVKAVAGAVNDASAPWSESSVQPTEEADEGRGWSIHDVTHALFQEESESPETQLCQRQISQEIRSAQEKLDPLARVVIDRVFLGGEQLFEVAQQLGYSRCHISRVKKDALDRLRKILAEHSPEETESLPKAKGGSRKVQRRGPRNSE